MFNHATGSLDPSSAEHFGDGFLLNQGFTLLWVGWQFDPPARPGLVRVYPPTATENGRPIRGVVRSDFEVIANELDHSLADRDHAAYAVVDPDACHPTFASSESAARVHRSHWGLPGSIS